jgi:hypothetical protein
MVRGKTGSRRVRIVCSAPYLAEWMNVHPSKDDADSPLWINRDSRKVISYARVRAILLRAKNRAGIDKAVNPHNFRHSRATHLANHLTEAQMKEFFGWTQGSNMASVYVHLSGRDVDKALLKAYGVSVAEEEKESRLRPRKCSRCGKVNPVTNKFCGLCGMCLDREAEMELIRRDMERRRADEILDRLVEDEEFRKILLDKVRSLLG